MATLTAANKGVEKVVLPKPIISSHFAVTEVQKTIWDMDFRKELPGGEYVRIDWCKGTY